MRTVFIIHGAYGNPGENWFPWLKEKLEKLGCNVYVPKFPTPEGQTLENWMKVFKDYKKYLNEDTIVVGHSLGPVFLLRVIEKLDKPIKAAFFVASVARQLGIPRFDKINKTFLDKGFDWDKIKQNCKRFYVYNSDNDPYVPLVLGKELAEKLDADLIVIKGAGHFNEKTGYTEFHELLEKLEKLINN
ncbi:MAG: serine hydrolase family protein [Candidatus Woesearchaeota archaeon]|nr:MAG: serine hydrolase family protein [Candidatus Woesearchaeota archaeon]